MRWTPSGAITPVESDMTRFIGFTSFCIAVATMSSACFFQFDVGCVEDKECPLGSICDESGQCQPDPEAEGTTGTNGATNGTTVDDNKGDAWSVAEVTVAAATGGAGQSCDTWWDCPHEQVCSGLRSAAICVAPENCTLSFENFGEGACSGSLRCADVVAAIECSYDGNISTCSALREDGQLNEFVAGGVICEDAARLFDQVNTHASTRVFPNDAR
jgi:hypothetical protein